MQFWRERAANMPNAVAQAHPWPEGPGASKHQEDVVFDVRRAISGLESQHQDLILLCDFSGFTLDEAAQALDIPRETAKSRLYRARELVRLAINPKQEMSA